MRKLVRVIVSADYEVYIEELFGFSFLHCHYHNFNKRSHRQLIEDFQLLKKINRIPLYAAHNPVDKLHEHFLISMGFEYLKTIINEENENKEIWVTNTEFKEI